MTMEDRPRIHPHERFSSTTQLVRIDEAAVQLRAEVHAARNGHKQIALARNGPLSILLFVFERDGLLKAHRADGEVIIQVMSGELEVTLDAGPQIVSRGELLTIAAGATHSVRANEASEMLLTICHRPAT